MQFVGQTHILNVPLPSAEVDRATLQSLFEKAYFARFKVELPEIRANLVNLNTSVIGVRPAVDLSRLIDPAGRADDARRRAAARGGRSGIDGGWLDTPVYAREKLPLDAVIDGPGDPRADGCDHRARARRPGARRMPTAIIIIDDRDRP